MRIIDVNELEEALPVTMILDEDRWMIGGDCVVTILNETVVKEKIEETIDAALTAIVIMMVGAEAKCMQMT
jgi:hypothetical protein